MSPLQVVVAAFTLLTYTQVTAQVLPGADSDTKSTVTQSSETLIIKSVPTGTDLFRLGAGGCLIGPMLFYNLDGSELFKIVAGDRLPNNCGK